MPFLELFARIDAVDCAAIMETAKEFIVDKVDLLRLSLWFLNSDALYFQDVAIAAVGPLSNLLELSWFRSQTSSDERFAARKFWLGA